MNGYFQLLYNEKGTFLYLYPPTEGGEPVRAIEVGEYLQFKGIPCDIAVIGNVIASLTEAKGFQLSPQGRYYPESEMLRLEVSPDRMEATVRFYPPSVGGAVMSEDDILRDLQMRGILSGIQREAIQKFINKREYCTDFVIAKGTPAVQGHHASIEYFFNTDPRVRPTLREDGTVDFFNLNTLNHCKKGDILAKLTPENSGEYGEDVYGGKIKPAEVKKLPLKFGHNIQLSEDKTVITSEVNGHVLLIEDKVFVSDVYIVENVDNSTGNIEYEGSVQINGNVCSNFSVKAKGNIDVKGVVEGAFIEAEGNIIIARGMKGGGTGILKAGGNILSKFLEHATAEAGGYVEADSIVHCQVRAKTEVNVNSKKGFITGGRVCARDAIKVKALGSPMGADTVVEVGVDPSVRQRYQELQKSVVVLKEEIEAIRTVLNSTLQKTKQGIHIPKEKMKGIQAMAVTGKEKQIQLDAENEELETLMEMMESASAAYITVSGTVYSGTKIVISENSMMIYDSVQYCRFARSKGEIKMTSL